MWGLSYLFVHDRAPPIGGWVFTIDRLFLTMTIDNHDNVLLDLHCWLFLSLMNVQDDFRLIDEVLRLAWESRRTLSDTFFNIN